MILNLSDPVKLTIAVCAAALLVVLPCISATRSKGRPSPDHPFTCKREKTAFMPPFCFCRRKAPPIERGAYP